MDVVGLRVGTGQQAFQRCIGERHAFLDEEPRACHTDLAGIARNGTCDSARNCIDLRRVGEDELRALAAQLQRERLRAGLGAGRHDLGARARGTGEGDFGDAWVPYKCVACGRAVALYNVEYARRDTGLDSQFRETQHRERRHLRGLDDHCVARRQRRPDLP